MHIDIQRAYRYTARLWVSLYRVIYRYTTRLYICMYMRVLTVNAYICMSREILEGTEWVEAFLALLLLKGGFLSSCLDRVWAKISSSSCVSVHSAFISICVYVCICICMYVGDNRYFYLIYMLYVHVHTSMFHRIYTYVYMYWYVRVQDQVYREV